MRCIGKGNTADTYLAENGRALKVYHANYGDSLMEKEMEKQRFARAQGLPVPEVFGRTMVDGLHAMEMEYVQGPSLGDLATRYPEQIPQIIALSTALQRRMHGIDAGGFHPMHEKLSRQIHDAALGEEQKKTLLTRLDALPRRTSLCHGDFHAFNLIRQGETVYILDWLDATAGDPAADIGRTYLIYREFSEDLAEQCLAAYQRESGLSREDILQWLPVLAGARLAEGGHSPERVAFLQHLAATP